jgi:hypothetical protein
MANTSRATWFCKSVKKFSSGLNQNFRRIIAQVSTQAFLLAYGMPNFPPVEREAMDRGSMTTSLFSLEDDDELWKSAIFFARTRPHLYIAMVRVHVLESMIDSGMRSKTFDWHDYFDWRLADVSLSDLQADLDGEKMLIEMRRISAAIRGF